MWIRSCKMPVQLKKLNFRTFAKSGGEMYTLLENNRTRLSPWFWWADEKVTPTKLRFYVFMTLYLTDTKRKKIAYKFNSSKQYDEQFFIYNESGKIGGMCGLDNIDIKNTKDAELWYLTFQGNKFGMADMAVSWVEDYSIDMGLNSLYAKVQSTNEKSVNLMERNNYVLTDIQKNVRISKHNPNLADMFTYKKQLSR